MNKLTNYFALLWLSCALVLGISAVSVSAQRIRIVKRAESRSTGKNYNIDEQRIFDLVNDERRRRNLREMFWSDELAATARKYSRQMAQGNFFSHFDNRGKSVVDRVQDENIKGWSKIGENLFYCEGINDFDAFSVKGWMNSPTHRQNILDRDWTDSGIGIAASRDGKIYVTQVFMRF